jgi:hypothetical protein
MTYHYHSRASAFSLRFVTSARSVIQFGEVPSLGNIGALRALAAGMLDIAVAGRRLSSAELLKDWLSAQQSAPIGASRRRTAPNGLKSMAITMLHGEPDARQDDGRVCVILQN